MSANYKQLEKFAKDIERLNEQQKEEFIIACCKELAARLLRDVIANTPVGERPERPKEQDGAVIGVNGGKRSFLTAEEANFEQYWGDYQGGTLRRGWTVETHEEAESGKEVSIKKWCDSVSVKRTGDIYVLDIVNPVEYAAYVEYGHRQEAGRYVPAIGRKLKKSWVDGRLMLTKAEVRLNAMSESILAKKLRKFIKEAFDE